MLESGQSSGDYDESEVEAETSNPDVRTQGAVSKFRTTRTVQGLREEDLAC